MISIIFFIDTFMFDRTFLNTFLVVYRTGSQSLAADSLHLTQPAISQQLKQLEARIGRSLFIKQGRNIKPTMAAHQLAFAIGAHIDALDKAWQNFRPTNSSAGGVVYFGGIAEFFGSVIAPHISPLIGNNIQIRFEIGHDILLEKLLQNELDLAQFCAHIVHPEIEVEKLYQQDFLLVGHPKLTKKIKPKPSKNSNINIIDQMPWIAYDESLLFIKEYYQTVFNKDFTGNVLLMIKDLWSIAEAVAGGAGITVLPSYFCKKYLNNGSMAILYKPKIQPTHHFYLGWKKGAMKNPRIAKVREIVKHIVMAKNVV